MNHENKILLLAIAAGLASALASRVQAQTAVQAWAQVYSAPANSSYTDQKLVVDSFGNVIVAGTGNDESGGDWLVFKYTGAGVALWTNRYNGPGNGDDQAVAAGVDASGNVFVTGMSVGTSDNYDYDYATIKIPAPVRCYGRAVTPGHTSLTCPQPWQLTPAVK